MGPLTIICLAVGIAGVAIRPFRLPAWSLPVLAALVVLGAGGIDLHPAGRALQQLADPIGFLLTAVPLSVLLDRLGFFGVLAEMVADSDRLIGGLWILAALVTTVLNLDAAVVLLTPLYIRVARQRGLDPLALAWQPLILSLLASSALGVSNLTNLIAQQSTGATSLQFLRYLGLPSLLACVVGWFLYRFALIRKHSDGFGGSVDDAPVSDEWSAEGGNARRRRILMIGGAITALVLVGFVGGGSVGVQPWMVALGADLILLVVVRQAPWSSIPFGTALVAAGLGILARAAIPHLPLDRLVGNDSVGGMIHSALGAGVLANLVNNLPALLVLLPVTGHHPGPTLWAVLLGVNMGPSLLATGTLAALLWLDTLRRLEVPAGPLAVSKAGIVVGLPAATAGLAVLVALRWIGLV